jgi:hypothetical protein
MNSFKSVVLLFIMTAAFNFCYLKASSGVDNNGDIKKSFNVNKGGTLKVSINTGDITIQTWNKNEVNIRIGDVDENRSGLNIYQSGNNIIVQYNGSGYYNSNDVRVYVPTEYSLDLRTNQGDIALRNDLKGTCQAVTGGGDINLSNITGYVNVKTNGGEVTIGNIYNDLVLSTNGGDIIVGNIYGKGDVQTMGGSIKIGNVGKYLYAKTMGGDIETGDIGGNADVNTMGGSINVKKVSGTAKLTTNGGDIKILGSWGPVYSRTYGGSLNLYNINGSITASTSAGDIYAELRSVKGYSKIESMNGSVRFYIDPNAKATIYAKVNLGGWEGSDEKPIQSDFPAKNYESGKYSGTVSATYLINGGGETINISTVNDGIEIRKLRK